MSDLSKRQEQLYGDYVKAVTPTHNVLVQMAKAFLVGGCICVLGQLFINTASALGADRQAAATWCSVLLVLLSALLTGFGLYARLAKWGGAGALVPITGFANSVAACAIEFTVEGQVFGIGCKIFNIAGPVILYGVFTTWLLGLGYWLLRAWSGWGAIFATYLPI